MTNRMNVSLTLSLVDRLTGNLHNVVRGLHQVGRAARDLNRSAVGVAMSNQMSRVQSQVRGLLGDMRALTGQATQFNSAMSRGSGGNFAQRQVADLRQVLQLQQQVLANNSRMIAGPGGGRGPGGGGGTGSGGLLGRSGFSPNASIQDRLQYRSVNMMERSFTQGFLQSDIARTRLRRLDLAPEAIAEVEHFADELNQRFQELTKSGILETFGEIVTQFRTTEEAFRFLPYLLRTQQLDIQAGRDRVGGRDGMLQLLRSVGLTGRLTDNEGNFTEGEASAVLDAYMRAREVGGADINPRGFFQLVKYMKSVGQTLNVAGILESAIASPDIGHSTFGNQMAMMVRGLAGGRATNRALEAQARWGLRTAEIDPNHPDGPNKLRPGALIDAELERDNPMDWWRKHILGSGGVLRRMGIDHARARPSVIAEALAPLFSNTSAENIANMFSTQQAEWKIQFDTAMALNRGRPMWERGPMDDAADKSFWTGLQRARAQLENAVTSIANNFKDILLPPLFKLADGLQAVARWTDPKTGNPYLNLGLMGGAGIGGFMLQRRLMGGMGGTGRTLLGLGLGGLVGGGVTDALMGGLMARGFGGSGATAAAGAAGAAAALTWRSRFFAVLRAIPGGIARMGLWGVAISGIAAIVDNWQAVSERLKAIWADLQNALPAFLGGGGQGYGAFARGPNVTQAGSDLEAWLQGVDRSIKEWAQSTQLGQWMQQNGWAQTDVQRLDQDAQRTLALGYGSVTPGSPVPVTVVGKGSLQPLNVQVTVNVAQTNASPEAIGEAAGNAVGSRLRGALSDAPSALD